MLVTESNIVSYFCQHVLVIVCVLVSDVSLKKGGVLYCVIYCVISCICSYCVIYCEIKMFIYCELLFYLLRSSLFITVRFFYLVFAQNFVLLWTAMVESTRCVLCVCCRHVVDKCVLERHILCFFVWIVCRYLKMSAYYSRNVDSFLFRWEIGTPS
jgi:hypothetical protein